MHSLYIVVCWCAGRLLNDKSLGEEACVRTLNVLACAALKDDVILLLHQDRREHILMNYAFDIDRLPLLQQKALALFVRTNMFSFIFFQTIMIACEMSPTPHKCKGTSATTGSSVHLPERKLESCFECLLTRTGALNSF